MKFKKFYEANDLEFSTDQVYVTIKELPMALHERLILEDRSTFVDVIKFNLKTLAQRLLELDGEQVPAETPPETPPNNSFASGPDISPRFPDNPPNEPVPTGPVPGVEKFGKKPIPMGRMPLPMAPQTTSLPLVPPDRKLEKMPPEMLPDRPDRDRFSERQPFGHERIKDAPMPDPKVPKPEAEPEVEVTPTKVSRGKERKFLVTAYLPKTATAHKLGHYGKEHAEPKTWVVFARNEKEAQEMAMQKIHTMLDPKPGQELKRQRKNYLAGMEPEQLGLGVSRVNRDWDSLTHVLSSIPNKDVSGSFDMSDLRTILSAAKQPDFREKLARLDKNQLAGLKKVYKELASNPNLPEDIKKAIEKDITANQKGSVDSMMRGRTLKPRMREIGEEDPEPARFGIPDWDYHSYNEPKTEEEERALRQKDLAKIAEIYKAGMKYGIPPKDIRSVAKPQAEESIKLQSEEQRLYKDIWNQILKALYDRNKSNLDGYIVDLNGNRIKGLNFKSTTNQIINKLKRI